MTSTVLKVRNFTEFCASVGNHFWWFLPVLLADASAPLVFALARIEGNIFRDFYRKLFLGELILGQIRAYAPVFAPARMQEKIPANFFMY